jgi:hypothetical protein
VKLLKQQHTVSAFWSISVISEQPQHKLRAFGHPPKALEIALKLQ